MEPLCDRQIGCLTCTLIISAILLMITFDNGTCGISVPVRVTNLNIYQVTSRSFLPVGMFHIVHGVSDIQCYSRCLLSIRCLSVNYQTDGQVCELSNMTVSTESAGTIVNLQAREGWHYIEKNNIPVSIAGQCSGDSTQVVGCGLSSPSCSLDGKTNSIIEEKAAELLAHTSCRLDGVTEICDSNTNTWLPHLPNCAGLPPQGQWKVRYTLDPIVSSAIYECVDEDNLHVQSYYDAATRTWSQPDMECEPLSTNWDDPPPLEVSGVETFVERPSNGLNCQAVHKCKTFTSDLLIDSCPVSKCDGYFNWTDASLSCSGFDCFRPGQDYPGHVTCTRGGVPCQRWDSQTPHGHAFLMGRSDLENWCVEEAESRPWCYTTDPAQRWDFALSMTVIKCSKESKAFVTIQ